MIGGVIVENLYKLIRQEAKLSQVQFAAALGTTPLSINRWENGKTEPNRMAQTQLFRFCAEHGIELGEAIVSGKEFVDKAKGMILHHGSKTGIKGELAPLSRSECDFGRGFYMGTSALQPLTLICSESAPKFYTVSLDTQGLKVLNLGMDLDWAMLIAYCRGEMKRVSGSELYEKYAHFTDGYDLVVGYIANDRMYTELSRFFHGDITDVALIHCMSALDLGKQYVAVSEKACKQIKIIKEESLTSLELTILADMSAKRRKEGIRLADEVVKQYRREGRFFDEIIGG